MKIRLFEVPEEGKHYVFNRKTAELNEIFEDLIGNEVYEANLFLRPINSKDFELTGKIQAQSPESCSRCGDDMIFPIQQVIREILIPKQAVDKTGKYSKLNHVLELQEGNTTDVLEVEDEIFDVGEYLHEVVALAVPFNPAPPVQDGSCGLCKKAVKSEPFVYDEPMDGTKQNPFAALKTIKLN